MGLMFGLFTNVSHSIIKIKVKLAKVHDQIFKLQCKF